MERSARYQVLAGCLVRRDCWTLSLRGKILASVLLLLSALAVGWGAHPFLAVSNPVTGGVLVLEGWAATHALSQAADEFVRGQYRRMVVVRPVYGAESEFVPEQLSKYVSTIVQSGVPRESIDMVFCEVIEKDRTYHSALAVKHWFESNGMLDRSLTVASVGPHARRSWITYQKVFGGSATVGVIALNDRAYDWDQWWRSSEGVRE